MLYLMMLATVLLQDVSTFDRDRITITDSGYVPYKVTNFDAGPAVGNILLTANGTGEVRLAVTRPLGSILR